MGRNLLLTPGPTKLLAEAQKALAKDIIHHRTPQFQENLKEAIEGLQYVFQTKNEIYLLASSGTGGMEASVANLLSPGDKAITVQGGKFGERWSELCQAYHAAPIVIDVEWGKAVDPNKIKELLGANTDVKAVFITLTETSTGATPDIKAIGEIVGKTDAVLVVDGVSGLGVQELQTDNWGVDIAVSGSHKGFMLPPGLAFLSVSDKAYALMEKSNNTRYYFDLRKAKKAFAKTDTPFTPAIGLVVAILESIKYYKSKGLENLLAEYGRLAQLTREAGAAIGLTVFTDESCRSNTLTAFNVPDSVDGGKLVKILRDTHGISVAGGQGDLKGKIFRIAHMGCVDAEDLKIGFTYLEKVLKELGHQFEEGASIAVFDKVKV